MLRLWNFIFCFLFTSMFRLPRFMFMCARPGARARPTQEHCHNHIQLRTCRNQTNTHIQTSEPLYVLISSRRIATVWAHSSIAELNLRAFNQEGCLRPPGSGNAPPTLPRTSPSNKAGRPLDLDDQATKANTKRRNKKIAFRPVSFCGKACSKTSAA